MDFQYDVETKEMRTPRPTLMGHVYAQNRKVGQASFHFEERPYISFANMPDSIKLDNDSKVPQQNYLESQKYFSETRTFNASVKWSPSFEGASLWEFTLVFSEDCSIIESGQKVSKDSSGQVISTDKFGLNEKLFYQVYIPEKSRNKIPLLLASQVKLDDIGVYMDQAIPVSARGEKKENNAEGDDSRIEGIKHGVGQLLIEFAGAQDGVENQKNLGSG